MLTTINGLVPNLAFRNLMEMYGKPIAAESPSADFVLDLFFDSQGSLWIETLPGVTNMTTALLSIMI